MFRERFLVTIILGPLALWLVFFGSWPYFIPIAAILLLATIEYRRLTKKLNLQLPVWLLVPLVLAFWLAAVPKLVGLDTDLSHHIPHLLLISLLASLTYALWLYEKRPDENAFGSWMALLTGFMLLGWLGSHFFLLRSLEDMPIQWTALTLLASWSADGSAFLVGKSIGRHKLSPRLSPKKTVEGYIGGVVFGALITAIAAAIINMPLLPVIMLSLVIGIITPAGDLGISLLKREAAVKDSGNFLPGHGGALDRVDTILWSVTIAYYLIPYLV